MPTTMHSAATPLQLIRRPRPLFLAFLVVTTIGLSGCSHLRSKPSEKYLYVTAKSTFLRDRIAAVSNRTGNVSNGQRVLILEQNRRFYRVKTDKGEVGWIDERAIAPGSVADAFDELQQKHSNDPAIANGSVRDDVYLHVAPGRDTDKLFRLDEGEKLHLLQRASTLKPVPPGAAPMRSAPGKNGVVPTKTAEDTKDKATEGGGPEPPAMEDWRLVQDSHNHTGWMLSRMLDVDAPDSISRYAENQRIVGAYVLNKVEDPEVEGADKMISEYVVVLSPCKPGLPASKDPYRPGDAHARTRYSAHWTCACIYLQGAGCRSSDSNTRSEERPVGSETSGLQDVPVRRECDAASSRTRRSSTGRGAGQSCK